MRLVIVAGPSSSGKTTTTMKLCEALQGLGQELRMFALDNYFWNLKDQPQDEFGDYNFETPGRSICGSSTGTSPISWRAGRRSSRSTTSRPACGRRRACRCASRRGSSSSWRGSGFHRDTTRGIPLESQFRVYIEAICQLKDRKGNFVPWTDIRILRRMVRDNLHRNYTPLKTVGHWHYVRASEKAHIVPFIKDADVVVNGYLPYELPVHKRYLYRSLKEAVEHFGDAKGKEDAFRRAQRCLGYLEEVDLLEDDSLIPPTSLLREFIGGSVYTG